MTADLQELWKRTDRSKLYPPFAGRIDLLLQNCAVRGQQYYIGSGFRDVPDQDHLFALGRTIRNPDGWCGCPTVVQTATCKQPHRPMGNIVTNARGGQSNHNFSIAVDGIHDSNITAAGLQPEWSDTGLIVWVEEGTKLGLESGALWLSIKDRPHMQLPLGKHGILTFPDPRQPHAVDLLTTYQHGGHPAVWKLLDQYQWW